MSNVLQIRLVYVKSLLKHDQRVNIPFFNYLKFKGTHCKVMKSGDKK